MYIVRDRSTRTILHVNPAPVAQELSGAEIFFRLDPRTMEVGRGELPDVPEYFDIDADGVIVPWTIERQVEAGVKRIPADMKATGDAIVPKTLAEKVADGSVELLPTQKLVDGEIVQKTAAEQVSEGLIKLTPTQVVDGESIRERTDAERIAAGLLDFDQARFKLIDDTLVPKTIRELVQDGVVTLAPNEKLVGDRIVELNPRELLEEGRIDLEQYKRTMRERCVQAELAARRRTVSDLELMYALFGLRDPERFAAYKEQLTISRNRLDHAQHAIDGQQSPDELEKIVTSFEKELDAAPRASQHRISVASNPSSRATR